MLISEINFTHFLQNYSSYLFKISRCDRNNIFPHFCFSTYLILSKKYFRGFFKRLPIKVFFEISYIFVKNQITKNCCNIGKISLLTLFFDSPCMSQETRDVGLLKSTTPHETLSCTLLCDVISAKHIFILIIWLYNYTKQFF